jgi:DNA-binding NarL/FixJ family response regulator
LIRLLVVSGATLVRIGFSAALGGQRDLIIADSASSAAEARRLAVEVDPDVAVVDSHVQDEDPLSLAAGLREGNPRRGVVLVANIDDGRVLDALEAGLSAYLPSNAPVDVLLSAVRHAAVAPASFTAPHLAEALHQRSQERNSLSPREGEVLLHLRDGVSVAHIAKALLVSESTVKTYVSRLYDKLGVHDRTQALAVASRTGLLP